MEVSMEKKLVPFGIKGELSGWRQNMALRYGIDAKDWERMYAQQEGRCPGCKEILANQMTKREGEGEGEGLRAWVDWKGEKVPGKLGPQCKKAQVRGLVCTECRARIVELEREGETTRRLFDYLERTE
jgi:hypothetical protein